MADRVRIGDDRLPYRHVGNRIMMVRKEIPVRRSIASPVKWISAARRVLLDSRARSEWWTRLTAAAEIHQDVTFTLLDRYPGVFAAAQAAIGAEGAHRLLSFGCSSGEEVLTLRAYFPHASVVGAELNRAQLAACRRLPADPRIAFIESTADGIAARGPYDAIFCMAVLQRRAHSVERAGLTDISRVYPFARFDEQVDFLVAQLRPGGVLVTEHCHYRIEDSAAAALLETVPGETVRVAKGQRFDRGGRLIVPNPVVGRIFRKRPPS